MIIVDDRVGSKELLPFFPPGKAKLGRLEYADFSFIGNGPEGVPWLVGVERKTIGDLTNCIASGRMSGNQIEGLVNAYNTVYVVVEGYFKADEEGVLVVPKGKGKWGRLPSGRQFMVSDVELFLHTLENVVGFKTWRTWRREDTAEWIMGLYRWWINKEWDEHHGHEQPHTDLSPEFVRATFERRVMAQLKGVGWKRAKMIADLGWSVREMCGWREEQWREIEGIGEVLSRSIVRELNGVK